MLAGSLINFSTEMLYQMLIQGAIFLLFFILVKKFFYEKVIEIVDKRQDMITEEFDRAEGEKAKADSLREEYEEKVKSINEEALTITNNATKEAKEIKENIISEANEEARRIKAKSKKDIENARETAMKEMKDSIIDISFDITSKVLDTKLDKNADEALVKKAIESLDEVSYE
ncbi:F0F1 ATP synthase subunit B [Anaerofustis stercorihominis]|uniref:ATP synthase subunit b n=1 Tax=Anaerofustis stercorihominis TaxID=214853 RepID=A0A3E3DWN9_9FIRM|nr:F0F1 ATP synthase subunit B [Anaerofustis stercorihominis]RGD73565.1 ATP synthase F0 subunit B [Anaerofustis stercorihominis]